MSNQAWQLIDRPVTKSTMAQAGTDSRSRIRGKPLRTYGKRAAATDVRGEAPLKKRRTSEVEGESQVETETSEVRGAATPLPNGTAAVDEQDTPTVTTTTKPQADVKKGSIMNFFKPVPQPSSAASSPQPEEVESREASPPSLPSLPPQSSRAETRRKPRILKFRGSSLPRIDTEELDCGSETGSGADTKKEEESLARRPRTRNSRSPMHNRQESPRNETSDAERSKRSKARPSPTVQTTLNISSQAAFSECKVCNTVWNPLHPEDVKFHKKQHAAVLRTKRKLKEIEL